MPRTLIVLLTCILLTAAHAATFVVDVKGADTSPGSATAPLATIQKALDLAQPGDTVLVRPGVYRGRVIFPRGGETNKPITLQGQPGAVIDSGEIVSGWEPATDVAPGVYRKKLNFPEWPGWNDHPFNLTWNNQLILHISAANMGKPEGLARLKEPPDSPTWKGVEALYGTKDGVTYLRFADGRDPNAGVVTVAAHWEYEPGAAVLLKGISHCVVRGFTIRNCTVSVMLKNGASDNVIEHNTLLGGKYGVFVGYYPWDVPKTAGPELLCHRNTIRGNEITLNFISKISMPHPQMQWVWTQFKEFSDNDREGVGLYSAGHDNEVSGNHIYEHWGGIQDWAASDSWADRYAIPLKNREFNQRLKVVGNHIHDIYDDGLEPTGGEMNAEWHDNVVHNCNANLRLKFAELGPCYIYRNRFYHEDKIVEGKPIHTGECCDLFHFRDNSDARLYLYHNTFAGYRGNKIGANIREAKTPVCTDLWIVNNIFSNQEFGVAPYGGLPSGCHADYNLIASVAKCEPKGEHNVVLAEKRLWETAVPGWTLTADSPARGKALDLSREWTLDGVKHPPLPGVRAGMRDLGALQFGEKAQ